VGAITQAFRHLIEKTLSRDQKLNRAGRLSSPQGLSMNTWQRPTAPEDTMSNRSAPQI